MKRIGKPVFFIVLVLIAAFAFLALAGINTTYGDKTTVIVKGLSNIRWGIDIRGGVDVTFAPPEGVDATAEELNAATASITQRLLGQGISDYEVYTDENKDRIIVRFPWKEDEEDFDPTAAISELGETAHLTFWEGTDRTDEKMFITEGKYIVKAEPQVDEKGNFMVAFEFDAEGAKAFNTVATRLAGTSTPISIWMDDTMISSPTVDEDATFADGKGVISGNFTRDEVIKLANQINSGALPFALTTETFNTISPTLGENAKDAMLLALLIALAVVCVMMIVRYRVPGVAAAIALIGQTAGAFACISGFFPFINGSTLTLPGLAGIILSIGMGVDANVLTSERIREELASGKTLEGAIDIGFKRGFTAVFDGNITTIIIALILMGAFGSDGILTQLFSTVFFMFGKAAAGSIYSFGFTLLTGLIFNFIMGVFASRLMLTSLSKFKPLRKRSFFGGDAQ